jgi:hypothetical protein
VTGSATSATGAHGLVRQFAYQESMAHDAREVRRKPSFAAVAGQLAL